MNLPPPLVVDGKPMRLGNRIGKGGEGEVYALADDPSRAIKFYTVADAADRERKIAAIVRMGLASRSSLVAFPIAIARDRAGRFKGFVMNLVRDHQPLFELYAPGARKQNFPKADYRFLVRVAANTARAIAAVHEVGCVIGDINHSGILVSNAATAALIDADSFQVLDGSNRYLCRVGVPEYTPPELQNMSLSSVQRTPNHDAFGLAIAIFQLLAMGRHPFVGSYTKGEMPISVAISEYRFAYSGLRSVGMTPPPGTCTLKDFTREIGAAFESAFGREQGNSRPTAKQWVALIEEFERSLHVCKSNALHHYSHAASSCPWCRMEQRLGNTLFLPPFIEFDGPSSIDIGPGEFNLAVLWAQIEAARIPVRTLIKPRLPSSTPSPSAAANGAKGTEPNLVLARAGSAVVAIAIFAAMPQLFVISAMVAWAGFSYKGNKSPYFATLPQQFLATEDDWDNALEEWERRCELDRIDELKSSLSDDKRSLERLKSDEAHRIASYLSAREGIQRDQFLERFRIRDFKIKGIGPSKLATLTSYNVESAANATPENVLNIPGFGSTNSKHLFEWQRECARKFVYNSQPNPTDQMAFGKIRSELQQRAHEIRQRFKQQAQQYLQAAQKCRGILNMQDPRLAALHEKRLQVEADLAFLGIAKPYRPARPRKPNAVSQRSKPSFIPNTSPRTGPPLQHTHAPTCPQCNGTMVRRTARRGRHSGNSFWGCQRYPRCRGTRPI